ncbi:hypothetical protein B0H63DRAFT_494735 [Podospora didyma]|uniref:Uncharacterized protein n=1 Tax=Podospora didyma TaxID=330526 RepID=A0AAE0U077_9PEZI|nr:hypothetical protein B0H63DRAFT_494735 [Podospora didyma]
MCDYTQREYQCGHFRWIASKWCKDYTMTHKRCQPNVTHFEYRLVVEHENTNRMLTDELTGECKPKTYPPWENMIRRSKHSSTSY